jgi:hypothetical protein
MAAIDISSFEVSRSTIVLPSLFSSTSVIASGKSERRSKKNIRERIKEIDAVGAVDGFSVVRRRAFGWCLGRRG